jgi:phosphoenolpyruvate synthase/pyruvate phosphate dikinase
MFKLNKQFKKLDINIQNKIKEISYEDFCFMNGVEDFKSGVNNFMERFGHFSDSGNDFSFKPWKETPTLLLHIIADYQSKIQASSNPYSDIINTPSFLKRLVFKIILKKVIKAREYKEKTSYMHTYSYGILRDLFLMLGDSYQKKDFLNKKEDIFYLYFREIREIAKGKSLCENIRDKIRKRKEDICRYKDMNLPGIIFGEQEPPPELSKNIDFKGIATSRGYCSGYIKVVKGISEYDKMNQGDILVIPYSDIGLAPLFSKAGAVISESGGILSHCSIIAREYKIPAITSVGGACSLEDNTFVVVDGYKGEIIISECPEKVN